VLDSDAQLTDTAVFLDNTPLTIRAGSTITSSGPQVTIDSGNTSSSAPLLVTGAGADFAVTGATTWLYIGDGSLSATDGAAATVAFLIDLIGAAGSSTLQADSTSSIEVGTAGDATAGFITIDAPANGVDHQIFGYGTIAGNIVNNGYISPTANGTATSLEATGAITGSGTIGLNAGYLDNGTIIPGAVMRLDGPVGSGQVIGFAYATLVTEAPKLILADPAAFSGTLDNFSSPGDEIDLPGNTVTGASVNGATMTVSLTSGGPLTFDLGFGAPTTGQLLASGSEILVLPIRELDWTGGAAAHSFSDRLNWNDTTNGANPAAAPPGTSDLAVIANAGSIGGSGTPYQLSFTGTNTVTGVLAAIDTMTETSGSLVVTGALSAAAASIGGTLAAKSGGRITSSGSVSLAAAAVIATDGGSSVEVGTAGTPTSGAITVDAGNGGIGGDGMLAAPVINNGTIDAGYAVAGSNTLEITGAVTGIGLLQVSNGYNVSPDVYVLGAELRLDSAVASTQTVTLYDTNDPGAAPTLVLGDPAGFDATLNGLSGTGNTLDLLGESITGASVANAILTVTVASGGPLTFNLGYGAPANNQMRIDGSEIHILPDREFVWTGAIGDDVGAAANWNDTTDGLNPAQTAPTATDVAQITGAGSITGIGTSYVTNFDGTNTLAGTLSAVSDMTVNSGSLTVTGSLNAADFYVYATLVAAAGGRITTSGIITIESGAEISVAGAASLEVGTAGDAAAGSLTVDAASRGIYGDGTLAASVINNGTIDAYNGIAGSNTMAITGPLSGDGTISIDDGYLGDGGSIVPGAVVQLGATVGGAETVDFGDTSDPRQAPTLQLAMPFGFSGTLHDFDSAGDTLRLTGQTATGVSVSGTVMTVTLAAGGPLTVNLSGLIPRTDQLLATGSEVRVVPIRQLDWIGPSGGDFADAGNWNDITDGLSPAATGPGIADLVSIANAGSVTGDGSAYQIVLAGTNTIEGSVTAVNSLTESSGTSTVTGTLAVASIGLGGSLAANTGGRITSSGPLTLTAGAVLAVDGTSFAEIGTAGTATEGGLTVDAAATAPVSGDGTLAAVVVNNGLIVAEYGANGANELEITGIVTGTGTLDAVTGYIASPGGIVPGGVLRLDSTVAASQQVSFGYSAGPSVAPEVILADPAGFAGTINYFDGVGDTLDLLGETVDGASVTGTIMTVTLSVGGPLTFNMGLGVPQTSQLQASGSTIRVVPLRDLTWTGQISDSFSNAGNWDDTSDGLNPAASAPSSSDLVSIANAGSIAGTGAAYQMVFAGGNTVAGSLTAANSLTETSGALTVTGTLNVAYAVLSGTVSGVSGGTFVSTGLVQLAAGSELTVDATSAMEVGTGDDATAGHLTVDPSSGVPLSGDGTLAAAVINNGEIDANGAATGANTLEVTGAVTGTGGFTLGGGNSPAEGVYTPGGILRLDGPVAATQAVFWDGTANSQEAPTLVLGEPAAYDGTLSNFSSPGDTLELIGETVTGASIVGNTLTVTVEGGGPETFNLTNTPAATPLVWSGANVEVTPCYLAGTTILTERGAMPVESLTTADRVITLSGAARPIRWIGFGRTLVTPRNRCDVFPVIVRRGALADNVPHRDLYVTRRHAMLIGAILVPVEHLINGVSVLWDDVSRVVEYYHVELDTHDVMFANGAPAESFRDDGSRELFQNAAFRPPGRRPEPPCRPVVDHGPLLEQAWRAVASRVGPPPVDWLTDDPDLRLVVDGRRIAPIYRSGTVMRFRVERPTRDVRIVSRSCIPNAHGFSPDLRRLGVGIIGVTLHYVAGRRVVPLWADELATGFHAAEGDIRWTKGIATLSLDLFRADRVDVELRIGGTLRYPREVA
jgi:fibronectin-binding autotransporter adhesin